MDARDRATIARILRVNHAGEYGAIRIYRAQLWLARRLYPEIVPFLEETLGHEIQHCTLFCDAMRPRNTGPCRAMILWGNGGLALGFLTALLGRDGVWICTAAVEATVHRHLEEQLHFLAGRDPDLYALISAIQEQELMHLKHAEHRMAKNFVRGLVLSALIANATEVLIWLSTWGASTRLRRSLRGPGAVTGMGRAHCVPRSGRCFSHLTPPPTDSTGRDERPGAAISAPSASRRSSPP
jgi:3-demethoxyubiquinol 3-hydroxylase